MAYKQTQQENVFINNGKTLATLYGFMQGKKIGKAKIRYEIRAGKKGTGKTLARVSCVFLAYSQDAAMKKLSRKVGGLEFIGAENMDKFADAGYVPDPFGR